MGLLLGIWIGCETAADSADSACANAPVIGWNDYGQALLLEHCQSCHASTAPDRYGAPEEVYFDSYDDVVNLRLRMLSVLETDPPSMPPAVVMPDVDHDMLVSWLLCDVGQ